MMDNDERFEFYLAEKLGMSVAELSEKVSDEELKKWKQYFWEKEARRKLSWV